MRFTPDEIRLAHDLKTAGLAWQPVPGHYVWDGDQLIDRASPFHDRVYFILDLKHFLRRSETMQRLIESMVWLPTWEQTRQLLDERRVARETVAQRLDETDAIVLRTERAELYRLLLENL